MVQEKFGDFTWDYLDMKGMHPDTCIHQIYTNVDMRPIRRPQRRVNPTLKEIIKDELQKLLVADFIYPISDSIWVSPLVVVLKKKSKWKICDDYRELNKGTLRD